jgi:membrane associated rhomboid family serine protease
MPIFNKLTTSNILIIISIIFTIIWYFLPAFLFEWSINNIYLNSWNYFHFILQFFTGTFLHSWIPHLLINSIFIYYFWNILEIIMWKNKFIIFFITSVLFSWILLSYLNWNSYTIWISWFVLAIIAYYTLELKKQNNIDYKWWVTAIIINIWIGFYPWVSLYWHLFWVIFWIIFFYLNNDFFKKQLIWLFKYFKITNNKEILDTMNTKKD